VRFVVLFGLVLAGCSSWPELSVTEKEHSLTVSNEKLIQPAVVTPQWLSIGPSSENTVPSLLEALELSTVGERYAAVLTTLGYVGVDRAQGLIGHLIALSSQDDIRLGSNDAALVLRRNGELARFANLSALLVEDASPDARLGLWPGWRTFDAFETCIAIGTNDRVSVSTDGGTTFRTSTPSPGHIVNSVWCGKDGLVVTEVAKPHRIHALISKNQGKHWTAMPNAPTRIFRDGAFLWGKNDTCASVLSVTGNSWIQIPKTRLPSRKFWLDLVSVTPHGPLVRSEEADTPNFANVPPDDLLNADSSQCEPTPVVGSAPKTSRRPLITSSKGPKKSHQPSLTCKGDACIESSLSKYPSRTRFGAGLAARTRDTQAPVIAVTDNEARTLVIRKPPDGCDAEAVIQGPGIILLLCKESSRLSIFASQDGIKWEIEGSLPAERSGRTGLDWTNDGTLLLGGLCPPVLHSTPSGQRPSATCDGHAIRLPNDIGASGLWRILPMHHEFVAARPMIGGRALLVRRAPRSWGALSLWLEESTSGIRHLCTIRDAPGALTGTTVHGRKIHLTFETPDREIQGELRVDRIKDDLCGVVWKSSE
jgi:hypothetical protein